MPASTKTKSTRTQARGLLLTSRVRAILVSVYEHRQLSREQITRLHFQPLLRKENRYPSIMPRLTLQRLTEHGYLTARPRPVERAAGRPPLVYSIGENAIPVVAETLDRPVAQLLPRVRLDQELSWLFYAHRSAISDVRISLTLACEHHGYGLLWYADEQIAALKETTRLNGKAASVRPDAFLVIDPSGRAAPAFLEVQLQSQPKAYLEKAHTLERYYTSGAYTQRFGFKALRVLAVTDTPARARHLHTVLSEAPTLSLSEMFWSTSLPELMDSPFGSIWRVPQFDTPQPLLQER